MKGQNEVKYDPMGYVLLEQDKEREGWIYKLGQMMGTLEEINAMLDRVAFPVADNEGDIFKEPCCLAEKVNQNLYIVGTELNKIRERLEGLELMF